MSEKTIYELFRLSGKQPDGMSVEVEAEFNGMPEVPKCPFKVEVDGSLLNTGIEYISRQPKSVEGVMQDVNILFESEDFNARYIKSNRTSTHVHLNVQNVTKTELFTILVTYYLVEHYLFEFVDKSRKHNLFCLPLYAAEYNDTALQAIWDVNKEVLRGKFNTYKYAALNVANVGRLGTIEFRHLEGTRDPRKLKKWLELIQCIFKSKDKFQDMKAAYEAYVKSEDDFIDTVFGKHKAAMKKLRTEDAEINLSKVIEIIDYPDKKKEEFDQYIFLTARAFDDLEYDIFTEPKPYKTTPMEV